MVNAGVAGRGQLRTAALNSSQPPLEHYLRLLLYRKWIVLSTFLMISLATFIVTYRMPDIYTSETLILVDPQKVPEAYVKPTVTGDVRNRLGTLSQQILSATRLQKIIEKFHLYPSERRTLAREDVITKMRNDILVRVVSDFGAGQDLQAFRISYSGREPQLVAQVTNELASLFIEENLKAREQQATGTTEFLKNQLEETRKALETQEAQLRDFKLKHIGELPEQQSAALQILGQLQSQLQLESDALSRAEQQKSYIQTMIAQSAPVMDVDEVEQAGPEKEGSVKTARPVTRSSAKARLEALRARYTDSHPDVQKLKQQVEEEEGPTTKAVAAPAPVARPVKAQPRAPIASLNPVLQSQLNVLDAEIAKRKEEQQRLSKLIAAYRSKLEAIPVREQEVTRLVRDYEISKEHYRQLLEKQLSAETATQLEIRQQGEKFAILDPAQVAERPSRPNRTLLNAAGSIGGLGLGVVLALISEVFGMSITAPQHITAASNLKVLEVIPLIRTRTDQRRRKRRLLLATASAVLVAVLGAGALAIYHYRGPF